MNVWIIVGIVVVGMVVRLSIDVITAILPESAGWRKLYEAYGIKGRVRGKAVHCPIWIGSAYCQFSELAILDEYFEFGFGSR